MNISAVSFDFYGTLIDTGRTRAPWLDELASTMGDEVSSGRSVLAERWAEIQWRLAGEAWRPYREVIVEATRVLAEERGWTWAEVDAEELEQLTGRAQPFPEVRETLRRLRNRGYRLAIASNTDDEIIGEMLKQLGVDFDVVVTAEACRAYKPAPRPMERVLRKLDLEPSRVLHVAAGYRYDIPMANRPGCPTAWVNRRSERIPGSVKPNHEWRDLKPLTTSL